VDGAELGKLPCTVFDTKTTGLSPTEDELISIGAIRIVNGRLLRSETFDQLIEPGRPVRPESVAVHGISGAQLAGQSRVEEALPGFARFAEDTVLVGHNCSPRRPRLGRSSARILTASTCADTTYRASATCSWPASAVTRTR
jgi:DNA polymerase III subunit epsilon